MKVSLNWIKDYVQLPENMDLSRLAYDLTMSTVEVEDATDLAKQFEHMLVGQIVEICPHPNADKLKICRTDIGGGDIREIVCGGTNIRQGMKVAVAAPGAFCRWHGEGEPVEIKETKLRGVKSYGMICASSEIGLFDLFPYTEEATILDLSDFDAPAGTPIADALELNDIILEIDNKSMTNRPDLWGHYGIARELAALYDLPLKQLEPFTCPDSDGSLTVTVEDPERCPRYIGAAIEGLSVKPSPFRMQSRIWRVGMRPINALVDITNYVMLATGQPTHAFDSDNIAGHIIVRRAENGEALELLNGKELQLTADDLVIADEAGVVGLAGVMGGAKDSVLPGTHRVILEIANFQAAGIRRTALRYDNRTEASSRYEKAVDPERCDQALSLAMELFHQLYPEMRVASLSDFYPEKLKQAEIDVSLRWLERRLGKHLTQEQIAHKLGLLGFQLAFDGDNMHVTVPTWRSTGDVAIKADIMEEVARMVGYENFEAAPITTSFDGAINQLDKDLERRIKEYLAIRCGMQEVFTYPWMDEQYVNAILQDTAGILALSTPPSPSERLIRSSLLPNLCKAVAKNERYYTEFALFETAQVFRDEDYSAPYDHRELLPSQHKHAAGAFVAPAKDVTALFRRAKGALEQMPRYTHMEGFTFRQEQRPVWADQVVWLNLYRGEVHIGDLALLNRKSAMACGIKNLAVMLFELDMDALEPFRSRTNRFAHLPEYPMTDYDISLLFDSQVKWSEMYEVIAQNIRPNGLLHGAQFVDEYHGKQVPQGKKSVTIRLSIGSLEKTLTSTEIEECAGGVIKRLSKKLGAELRSR